MGARDSPRAAWALAAGTRLIEDLERPSFVRYISPRVFVVNARDAEEVPLRAEARKTAAEVSWSRRREVIGSRVRGRSRSCSLFPVEPWPDSSCVEKLS